MDIWQVDLPHLVLSTRNNSTLGGVAFDQDEAVEYDAVTNVATKIVNQSIFNGNKNISARDFCFAGRLNIEVQTANRWHFSIFFFFAPVEGQQSTEKV